MNIYLDIDGVLLANDLQIARYTPQFLNYVTDNYPVYWLTTHCKGDSTYTISHLSRIFDLSTLELAKKIKPTDWRTWKTEAIDFASPFLWFDDYIFDEEKEELKRNDVFDSWIEINLSKDPDYLRNLLTNFPTLRLS